MYTTFRNVVFEESWLTCDNLLILRNCLLCTQQEQHNITETLLLLFKIYNIYSPSFTNIGTLADNQIKSV